MLFVLVREIEGECRDAPTMPRHATPSNRRATSPTMGRTTHLARTRSLFRIAGYIGRQRLIPLPHETSH